MTRFLSASEGNTRDPWARWLGSPLLHFLCIGFLGFAVAAASTPPVEHTELAVPDTFDPYEIVFSDWEVATLLADYYRETGLQPSANDKSALLNKLADEEMLFREAMAKRLYVMDSAIAERLANKMEFLDSKGELEDKRAKILRAVELGLHTDDVVVRRILVQKMKLVTALQAGANDVAEAELERWYAANAERFRLPESVELTQLFFGRGEEAEANARSAAQDLIAGKRGEAEVRPETRPLASPKHMASADERTLTKHFGANLATIAMNAKVGEWVGPVASSYGFHVLRVSERKAASLPDLDVVRRSAAAAIRGEQRDAAVEAKLIELRKIYSVRIASDGESTEKS